LEFGAWNLELAQVGGYPQLKLVNWWFVFMASKRTNYLLKIKQKKMNRGFF